MNPPRPSDRSLRITNRDITVTDDNMNCGGMNVTFNGTYQRVGPPAFSEYGKES